MRKYLLLFCCLFLFVSYSDAGVIIRGGGSSSVGCPSGTYELGYDGDHDNGEEYGCYESGTANEAGVEVDTGTYVTVTSAYVTVENVQNNHLKFTITGDISTDIDGEGSLFFSFYVVDDGGFGSSSLIEIAYSAAEIIYCKIDGPSDFVRCDYKGNSEAENVLSWTKSSATEYRCGYTWCNGATGCNSSTDSHAIKCVTTGSVTWGTPDSEQNEPINGFYDSGDVDPDTVAIGEYLSNQARADTTRTWDVFVVAEHKATDPGSL